MAKVDIGGTGIEVTVTGPDDAPAAILLHGFPDSGVMWRAQVPALVGLGYRTIVPDLRGYGGSDKPAEVDAYNILSLAGDVLGLLDHFGAERATVIGHDWGAALAWATAAFAGDRVERLVTVSVGHPTAFRSAGLPQREKSWYMLLFQFEGVAEQWLSNDGWANFRSWSAHPDADAVIAALERDGSLTPALNYYRANLPPESILGPPLELPPIQCPTMGVWSTGDMALLEAQMQGSGAYVAEGKFRYERLEGPGHWIPIEVPDALNELLEDFLAR